VSRFKTAAGISTLSRLSREMDKFSMAQNRRRTRAMASLKDGSPFAYHAALLGRSSPASLVPYQSNLVTLRTESVTPVQE
jgi:hypothetical protein